MYITSVRTSGANVLAIMHSCPTLQLLHMRSLRPSSLCIAAVRSQQGDQHRDSFCTQLPKTLCAHETATIPTLLRAAFIYVHTSRSNI